MSQGDIDRLEVIRRLIRKEIKQGKAAELLGVSTRQVKRIKKDVRDGGAAGVVHGLRGKPGNRRVPDGEARDIVDAVSASYADFTPAFAAEKLLEGHSIRRDPRTVSAVMVRAGKWKAGKPGKKARHLAWRPRRPSFGELEQFDGSYHAWLELRFADADGGHELCLLASIDDATGRITRAEFADGEGVVPVFAFWRGYLEDRGRPRSIYLDRFSTYRMSERALREDPDLATQFQRAMGELGVALITARTPQAKGRIERLFQTLQDRLVRDLRLAGVCTRDGANEFLRSGWLDRFGDRFAVEPSDASDLHRPLTRAERSSLDSIFSFQSRRVLRNDFTVAYGGAWYQALETPGLAPRPKDQVTVEERADGTLAFRLRGKYLKFERLPARPERASKAASRPKPPAQKR
jgi:hypothetical protein